MYQSIRISGTQSTFAAQVARDAARLPGSPATICAAIAALAAANDAAHGGKDVSRMSAAAPEWNAWAQANGCPLPYAGRGVQQHPDIQIVDAAVKAVVGGATGPVDQSIQDQLVNVSTGVANTGDPGFDDENFDWVGWGRRIWGAIQALVGVLGFGSPEKWATGTAMSNTDRLRAAQGTNAKLDAIAPLMPGALSGLRRAAVDDGKRPSDIPEWAYTLDNGKTWQLPYDRMPDAAIPALGVNTMAAVGDLNASGGGGNGTGPLGPTNGADMMDLFGPGIAPREITVRRCAGPYRMAINERCYHKDILPDKFRLNKPKPAIVPAGAGKTIREAEKFVNRIDRYANKHVRKVVHRSPEHHEHHEHHHHKK